MGRDSVFVLSKGSRGRTIHTNLYCHTKHFATFLFERRPLFCSFSSTVSIVAIVLVTKQFASGAFGRIRLRRCSAVLSENRFQALPQFSPFFWNEFRQMYAVRPIFHWRNGKWPQATKCDPLIESFSIFSVSVCFHFAFLLSMRAAAHNDTSALRKDEGTESDWNYFQDWCDSIFSSILLHLPTVSASLWSATLSITIFCKANDSIWFKCTRHIPIALNRYKAETEVRTILAHSWDLRERVLTFVWICIGPYCNYILRLRPIPICWVSYRSIRFVQTVHCVALNVINRLVLLLQWNGKNVHTRKRDEENGTIVSSWVPFYRVSLIFKYEEDNAAAATTNTKRKKWREMEKIHTANCMLYTTTVCAHHIPISTSTWKTKTEWNMDCCQLNQRPTCSFIVVPNDCRWSVQLHACFVKGDRWPSM